MAEATGWNRHRPRRHVKAIAADGDGNVLASARVSHPIVINAADELEHDIDAAWRDGVTKAYAEVCGDVDVVGGERRRDGAVSRRAHRRRRRRQPRLLYGDHRGRREGDSVVQSVESGELVGVLGWLRGNCPEATGFWPAQAQANHALCGRPFLDTTTAFTAFPLFDGEVGRRVATGVGVTAGQLPEDRRRHGAGRAGRWGLTGPLGGGTIDAMAEQFVAGADNDGDVLVICGTTLITWAVMKGEEWLEKPGLWTIPHTAPGKLIIGGPSNAGGLFLNWCSGRSGVRR